MDSRDSLDKTPDSIDLTESPVKHTNTQRQIEKINEDTSDNDKDETIIFDGDKAKKTYRKDINALRKKAKNVKTKKGRTIKMYAMNIERKKLLKQRREKALQDAKDRNSAKKNFLTAVKANHKANRGSKYTQRGTKPNDGLINGANADTTTPVDDIDNIEIIAKNAVNAATNAENIDTDSTNADNIVNAEIENDNSEDVVMTDNIDDAAMSDNHTSDAILGNN